MSTETYMFSFLAVEDVDEGTVQDVNALLSQLKTGTGVHVNTERLTLALTGDMRILVARCNSRIVGMGIICKVPRLKSTECEIHDVVVDHAHQRKGIAGNIVSMLVEEGRDRYRAARISLTSHPSREEANRLYQRHGFILRETNSYRLTLAYP